MHAATTFTEYLTMVSDKLLTLGIGHAAINTLAPRGEWYTAYDAGYSVDDAVYIAIASHDIPCSVNI
jgi:hypothetical protein